MADPKSNHSDGVTAQEKKYAPSSSDNDDNSATIRNRNEHQEYQPDRQRQASVAAKLRNPLMGMSEQEVLADADKFVDEKGLQDHRDAFHKGALLARVIQEPDGFESVAALSEDEKHGLRKEVSHRWSQPFQLYFLVVLCAGSAIVQGMDQTAVNGAQVTTSHQLCRTIAHQS